MIAHEQLDLLEPATAFDGETYDPIRDFDRLGKQMKTVVALLGDGAWVTLKELAHRSGGSEAGVSARLRDLRKRRYNRQTIERRRVVGGLWEYRWAEAARLAVAS